MTKVHSVSGVSMVFTLIVMMAVSVVCASVLKIASTTPAAAYSQQDYEQNYLAATSAAKLLKDAFENHTNDNYAAAIALLDKLQGTTVTDSELDKEFTLQIKKDAQTVNALNVKINMHRSEGNTSPVTASIVWNSSSARYSVDNLRFCVDTITWYDSTGNALARQLYPSNCPPETDPATGEIIPPDSVTSLSEDYYYTYFLGETATQKWTVIWKDTDGKILQVSTYLPSEDPEPDFNGTKPTKEADENGWAYRLFWDKTISDADNIITYTPKFYHVVQWKNLNGVTPAIVDSKNYWEDAATEPTTTVKANNIREDGRLFKFAGWEEGTIDETDKTIKNYLPKLAHTARWLNGDGSTLDTKIYLYGEEFSNAPYTGETPNGETPEKAGDIEWSVYTFTDEWTEERDDNDSVTIYTPVFEGSNQKYIVRLMVNAIGEPEQILATYEYEEGGTVPESFFTDNTPPAVDGCTFSDWFTSASEDAPLKIYYPIFVYDHMPYRLIWLDRARTESGAPTDWEEWVECYALEVMTMPDPIEHPSVSEYRDDMYVYTPEWVLHEDENNEYIKEYYVHFNQSEEQREPYIAQWQDLDKNVVDWKYVDDFTDGTPTCDSDVEQSIITTYRDRHASELIVSETEEDDEGLGLDGGEETATDPDEEETVDDPAEGLDGGEGTAIDPDEDGTGGDNETDSGQQTEDDDGFGGGQQTEDDPDDEPTVDVSIEWVCVSDEKVALFERDGESYPNIYVRTYKPTFSITITENLGD